MAVNDEFGTTRRQQF